MVVSIPKNLRTVFVIVIAGPVALIFLLATTDEEAVVGFEPLVV